MPRSEAVFIASRTIGIVLLIVLIFEIPTLPELVYALHPVLAVGMAGFGMDVIFKVILTPLLQLLFAIFFWRCGPLTQRLFAQRNSASAKA